MEPSLRAKELNQKPLASFKALFASTPLPAQGTIQWRYEAEFVGPGWLRAAAGPMLTLGGLSKWWGKEFREDGTAVNLVLRDNVLQAVHPMMLEQKVSRIDGQTGPVLTYPPSSPIGLRFLTDELRQLDETILLGLTIPKGRLGVRVALPFLLHRR